MFVPKRTPAANLVAAKQGSFNGCHLYLESCSDVRFWRYFVDENSVMLHACHGWTDVVKNIDIQGGNDIPCIGIVDNDFRNLIPYPDQLPNNVFTTDDHDIEMMALQTEASRRVISSYDASGKISVFEEMEGDIMEFVYGITDSIGLVKLVDRKYGLNMVFKKTDKSQTLELPSYENFLDNNGHYKSDMDMIRYLCSWSTNQKKSPNKTDIEIKSLTDGEKAANHDTRQLSCGHDACYILAYVIKKRIANKSKVTQEEIEKLLAVAYSAESLVKTHLYTRIETWSQTHGIKILKV